jgi:ankyrin repeat protein
LYVAAYNGHVDVVERLLAAPGVEINKARTDGATPLSIALARGHAKVEQKLRAAGATEPIG